MNFLEEINEEAEKVISKIHFDLRQGSCDPNIFKQISQIRNKIKLGQPRKDPDSMVDLYIKIKNTENYMEITTAKPNMKEFVALKLKLLRWVGLRLSQDKLANPIPRLAIPYNPYHPQPYERWTLKGLYDLENGEILVEEEFWNFVGGGEVYNDLLDIFQEAGKKLRGKINKKFAKFAKS